MRDVMRLQWCTCFYAQFKKCKISALLWRTVSIYQKNLHTLAAADIDRYKPDMHTRTRQRFNSSCFCAHIEFNNTGYDYTILLAFIRLSCNLCYSVSMPQCNNNIILLAFYRFLIFYVLFGTYCLSSKLIFMLLCIYLWLDIIHNIGIFPMLNEI